MPNDMPEADPLPGGLPSPVAQPSLRLQFHPKGTQKPRSLITPLHQLHGMTQTVAEPV